MNSLDKYHSQMEEAGHRDPLPSAGRPTLVTINDADVDLEWFKVPGPGDAIGKAKHITDKDLLNGPADHEAIHLECGSFRLGEHTISSPIDGSEGTYHTCWAYIYPAKRFFFSVSLDEDGEFIHSDTLEEGKQKAEAWVRSKRKGEYLGAHVQDSAMASLYNEESGEHWTLIVPLDPDPLIELLAQIQERIDPDNVSTESKAICILIERELARRKP